MESDTTIYNNDFSGNAMIVIGSEGKGVSEEVKKLCTHSISIPKFGKAESLNAAVATGIICATLSEKNSEIKIQTTEPFRSLYVLNKQTMKNTFSKILFALLGLTQASCAQKSETNTKAMNEKIKFESGQKIPMKQLILQLLVWDVFGAAKPYSFN